MSREAHAAPAAYVDTVVGMTKIVKGTISIALDDWLRAQHPNTTVTPERYLELYSNELQRDGWTIVTVKQS